MKSLAELNEEQAAVVLEMTQSQVIDDRYFKLIRIEREIKALIYAMHEPEPEKTVEGHPRWWSESDVRVLRENYKSEGIDYVARLLDRSAEAVRQKANAIGLTIYQPRETAQQ